MTRAHLRAAIDRAAIRAAHAEKQLARYCATTMVLNPTTAARQQQLRSEVERAKNDFEILTRARWKPRPSKRKRPSSAR
jgi:hypothetical protein